MAGFGKIALTNAGINALVKVQAGNPLVFTKIKMGSGLYTGDVKTLTDLTEVKLTAGIVKGTALENTYVVEAHFSNEGLTDGFYWREIGLYIKGSNGNDVLFGYANSGTTADYIPATTSNIYSKHIRIAVAVSDTQNITVEYTSGTYVDVITFNESMDKKVDKVNGKGLSTNDYSNEEKEKLSNAVAEINRLYERIMASVTDELAKIKSDIADIYAYIGHHDMTTMSEDGTVTGAIYEAHEKIKALPTITSGTTEPTGGSDGDVYIQYEE